MKTLPLYHYVVVRKDLPLGVLTAQVVHAAGESSPGGLPPDTHAVVLSVPNEVKLLDLEERLRVFGISHCAVREPDPPHLGALMAIGFPPQNPRNLRKVLSHLPLLR